MLRVGAMWDDGVVRPQPPMRRAMRIAVEKLRKAGMDVVDYKAFKSGEAWKIIVFQHHEGPRDKLIISRARCTFRMAGRGYGKLLQRQENHFSL